MDENSTNGTGPDKRNWRERLGIGAKEMPKLSDEFRDGSEEGDQARASGAQPVTKPAPMAPRAPRSASTAEAPSASSAAPPPPRATPRAPDNAQQDALADKLRAQRAAAERLAEQRVQAARERAEGRTPTQPEMPAAPPRAPSAARNAPPPMPPRAPRAGVVPPPPLGARPKFSFAEDPPAGRAPAEAPRPGLSGGPLSPPRPSLGGERGQPPFLRPSAPGAATRPPPSPYRPTDPGASLGAPPRLQPPPGRPGYGGDAGAAGYPAPRAPQRRPPALESYPRGPERERDYAPEQDVPRLGRPARGRGPDDYDEVFEDDGGGRQRASARDYQSAYVDREDAFAEDQRRSGGPWLLLLALLAAALVTGGVVWYYNNGLGNVAGTGASTGDVPVVNAPADPAKVVPETPTAGGEEPAARRKQIYDRIVGDQEVIGGQIQPTEEIPVQPASAQPLNEVPAAADTNPIPTPDAPDQGTGADGLPSVDEPPPLPLPPAGQEGNLGTKTNQQIAATAAQPAQVAGAPPPLPEPEISATSTTSSAAAPPPPPENATDGAVSVLETPAPAETASIEEPAPPPPPKKKPAAKKKPVEENLGSEPVVLVPPAEPIGESANSAPLVVAEAPATQPAEKKPRSIMDLFRGGSDDAAAPVQQETRVAAVEPPPAQPAPAPRQQAQPAPAPEPQQQQQAAAGSGFLVQLSSFRSEADARREYTRLAGAYPQVVGGLQQQIRQTSVGGSTRYQLGLGPLPSRSAATQVCSALITQGESDCIVRGR